MDTRDLDARALRACGRVIRQISPADLDRPTPCTAWKLDDLLRHLVGENRGFAANAVGTSTDRSVWDSGHLGTDLHRAYQDSAAAVTAAFAPPEVYNRQVEVREFGTFPGHIAVGLHAVDFLVHGWDVAASIGVSYTPEEELAASAFAIASRWPDTPSTRGPGAAFNTQVEVPADAPAFQRLLGLLGRSPSWVRPC